MLTPVRRLVRGARRMRMLLASTCAVAATLAGAACTPAVPPKTPTARTPTDASNNGLALTPPMGFNDWNAFGCEVNEQLFKDVADVLVGTGLNTLGYEYVNIDDCWMADHRDPASGRLVPDPVKFPDGIKAVADYVHSRGLKLGIYASAGPKTCAGYPGSFGHEQVDAQTFADWGVDYLKYDTCDYYGTRTGRELTPRYIAMADALRRTGRKIVYAVCEGGSTQPWAWAGGIGNLWRTTPDIKDTWASMTSIVRSNMALYPYAKPGAWNDPDMLEVGNGGMTDTEYRTQFALWSIMAAPLLIGTDLREATPATLDILSNRAVIAVDQDPLGIQGRPIAAANGSVVFAKPLKGGDVAVALYNGTDTATTISTTARAAGAAKASGYRLFDLWRNTTTETAGAISAVVPAHGTAIYRVSPAGRAG